MTNARFIYTDYVAYPTEKNQALSVGPVSIKALNAGVIYREREAGFTLLTDTPLWALMG